MDFRQIEREGERGISNSTRNIGAFWDILCSGWRIRAFARVGWDDINGGEMEEREGGGKDVSSFSRRPTCPLSRFRSSVNTHGNSNSRQALFVSFHLSSLPPGSCLAPLLPSLALVKLSRVVYDCLVCLSLSIHDRVELEGGGSALSEKRGKKEREKESACFLNVNRISERALSLCIHYRQTRLSRWREKAADRYVSRREKPSGTS